MVIVVVKNFGGTSESMGMQERKRMRAQPPDGWIGESNVVKKRQVGERAGKIKDILEIAQKMEVASVIDDTGQSMTSDSSEDSPESPLPFLNHPLEKLKNMQKKKEVNSKPLITVTDTENIDYPVKDEEDVNNNVDAEKEGWKDKVRKMQEQIKAVQDLPQIEVPKNLKIQQQVNSASSPDLTLYSTRNKNQFETSWEIRQRFRNMRSEQLYQSQLVKRSGYSWREKVPEMKSLKFSEIRTNAVTDAAFIGSTYVRNKETDTPKEKKAKNMIMTKVYKIDASVDIYKLKIVDTLKGPNQDLDSFIKIQDLRKEGVNGYITDDSNFKVLVTRLNQLLNFFRLKWQLMIKWSENICSISDDKNYDASFIMEVVEGTDVDEIQLPDLETVDKVIEIMEEEDQNSKETKSKEDLEKEKEDISAGDIKSKMTGDIAEMKTVKIRKPTQPPPPKVDVKSVVTPGGGDWRSEIKKRERAKQQERLNAMPLGMPDYREPEKGQVFDWRAKLKEDEKDNDPMNKWKKFDAVVVKKSPRPPVAKPKSKHPELPKEDPCNCNIGNCKVHFKFALKSAAKRQETSKTEVKKQEPSKAVDISKKKSSVKKKPTDKVSKSESLTGAKAAKPDSEKSKSKSSGDNEKLKRTSVAKDLPPPSGKNEVIKIINFVAIKVSADEAPKRTRNFRKKTEEPVVKPPPPTKPPPPPPKEVSPSPPPQPIPVIAPKPPSPVIAQPPKEPTPPPKPLTPDPICPTPEAIKSPIINPSSPTSPAYVRKFFPNPVETKPYTPKVIDITPIVVKKKKVEVPPDDPPRLLRRNLSDIEIKPMKFSAVQDNCVKKALFLGNQYVGDKKPDILDRTTQGRRASVKCGKESDIRANKTSDNDIKQQVLKHDIGKDFNSNDIASNKNNKSEAIISTKVLKDESKCYKDKKVESEQNIVKRNSSIVPKEEKVMRRTMSSREVGMKTNISQMRAGPSWRDKFKEDNGQDEKTDKQSKTAKKTKASTKIIDILTAKKIKDENPTCSQMTPNSISPKSPRRKLSEYVSEKLKQAGSNSRSLSPSSPQSRRRIGIIAN